MHRNMHRKLTGMIGMWAKNIKSNWVRLAEFSWCVLWRRAYGEMLKVVAPVIYAADLHAKGMLGGLAVEDPNPPKSEFVVGILDAGAAPLPAIRHLQRSMINRRTLSCVTNEPVYIVRRR